MCGIINAAMASPDGYGPKGYDAILLFKILILQSLYNLSDDAIEYQILDRYCFSRFLDLHISQKLPDSTTIWSFRQNLIETGVIDQFFSNSDEHLRSHGLMAMKGLIVAASIGNVPGSETVRRKTPRSKKAMLRIGR
nr:transposase [uncultured Desulfobulbus sp.]